MVRGDCSSVLKANGCTSTSRAYRQLQPTVVDCLRFWSAMSTWILDFAILPGTGATKEAKVRRKQIRGHEVTRFAMDPCTGKSLADSGSPAGQASARERSRNTRCPTAVPWLRNYVSAQRETCGLMTLGRGAIGLTAQRHLLC